MRVACAVLSLIVLLVSTPADHPAEKPSGATEVVTLFPAKALYPA